MIEKSSLSDRLRILRAHLKLSQKDFAQKIGFSRSYCSEIEKGKVEPTERFLKLIEQTFNVNPRWLREGEGEMFLEEGKELAKQKIPGAIDLSKFKLIPVYSVVGAGPKLNITEAEPIEWVPVPEEYARNDIIAIKVRGESMHPIIPDGAVVGIDIEDKHIVSGQIYCVWRDYEGMVLRRVFVRAGYIILKPENPIFPEESIPPEEIESLIVGKFKWVFWKAQ